MTGIMAKFEIAYERTAKFEGGYVYDPNDNGGETYAGISRKANPSWDGWKIVDDYKKKYKNFKDYLKKDSTLKQKVMSLYRSNYWNPVWGDSIRKQEVANELYDFAVNAGVATSIKLQQRQFKMKETGKMSTALLSKLNSVI